MKNAKKILLFALALVALTLVMSLSIFAEEPTYKADTVAVVNGVEYNSFDSAYNATPAGGTLKLVKGVSMVTKTFDKAITLDFNGQTMTFTNSHGGISLKNSGVVFTSTAATRGKIVYTGRVAAIRCWNADKIENIDIECSYDCLVDTVNGPKQIGGIVMQEGKTHINTIQNVNIYGVGLTQGIQTYNCGGNTNDDGTPWVVIDKISNVNIDATNNHKVPAEGMNLYAPVGTIENCEVSGTDLGIHLWVKGTYAVSADIKNCAIESSNGVALAIYDNGGKNWETRKVDVTVDSATTFKSAEDQPGFATSIGSNTTFEAVIPGYAFNADGTFEECTHTWVDATCTSPKTCSNCKATEGKALPHTYEITEKVEAKPGKEGYIKETCTICGNVKTMVIPATNFKIAARSLAIYETITVNYKCEIPAGYENVYMVFLFDNREITVTDFEIEESSGRYVFAFTGVTPLFMNENIHATVYAEVDGQVVTNVYEQYSIKQYCVNQLAKSIAPELRTFLIDFMVYGEKAQIMMNHNTGNLVTDGVDVSGKSSFTELDSSYDKRTITGTALDIAEWKTSTLYIKNTVNMQFKFVSSDLTGLKIKVNIKDRTQEFDASKLADTKDSSGRYIVTFANITAIEFNETVTATFWKDGVQIGQTMTYSVNSYIQRNQDLAGSKYATLVDFLKAMYLYGKSAYDL